MDGNSGLRQEVGAVDVSFVMPCLNEVLSLEPCIMACREALDMIAARFGLTGEVVVADNGSTDGSQALAERLGARVVPVAEKGYGAALRGGFMGARGRYLVMGDADGSYNFREAPDLIGALIDGADLCMGSRFKGGIAPGAMPWKNRYIGNPLLTGLLNVLFGSKIDDAHCGLRALTKDCFERLRLEGDGMEFASEMVIKAVLKGETLAERPVTLSPDLRDRPPHLRPWRDGWRHLRYLFMLSPWWVFTLPAMIMAGAGALILALAGAAAVMAPRQLFFFGDYWVILAGSLVSLGHLAAIMGMATHLHQVRSGYRAPAPWVTRLAGVITLESMLIAGAAATALGLIDLGAVVYAWSARDFVRAVNVLPAVLGVMLLTLGAQSVLGGFLLAILSGNQAGFLAPAATRPRLRAVSNDAPEWRDAA